MQLRDYRVEVSPGHERNSGYVDMRHNTQYTILLSNHAARRCDAQVSIDGNPVGKWRIPSMKRITLERPVHDSGRFTFFRWGSPEASRAGLRQGDQLGLVTVVFLPEAPYEAPDIRFLAADPGGTGLSGASDQRFAAAEPIEYDEGGIVTIHLRLVCHGDDPRPLIPLSTPIPPPVR